MGHRDVDLQAEWRRCHHPVGYLQRSIRATVEAMTEDGRLRNDKQPEVEPAGVDPALLTKGGGAVVVG